MVVWDLAFSGSAEKDFKKLDLAVRRRVAEKLDWLAGNFETLAPESLAGEFGDFFKIRIGDWRVFYRVKRDIHMIVVYAIVHRSKAYRG